MASNVKWIKMMVGMFDGMSFKKIKRAKIGGESFRDKLTAVWFELMDFAGKCNHEGKFISPSEIPFTDLSDIAIMIDREEEELKLCMSFFIKEGMVTVIDDVYSLSNWSQYQNEEGLNKIREQNRLRQKAWYDRQKALPNAKPNATEEDKEEEIELDIDRRNNTSSIEDVSAPPAEKISYQSVVNLYNSICVSFPKVKKLSEARRKAIKARLNTYDLDDFKRLFEMAEESYFLKGGNNRNWSASFDWLIADANMAKVLDGNYTDSKKPAPSRGYKRTEVVPAYIKDDLDRAERIMNGSSKSDDP